MSRYDAIVVGAGFSGAVMAERMAQQLGYRVLVLEQRDHIGGNCHDHYDEAGILIHTYGPHIFHTRHAEVWDYLSRFTEWRPYEHRVLGAVDGQLIPIPFNLTSLRCCYGEGRSRILEKKLLQQYGPDARVPILQLRQSEDPELIELADFIYEKVFVNYTAKQWGCRPDEILPEVTARVPVVLSTDDRYFQDPYQGVPLKGYTHLISRILDHHNIDICLSTPLSKRVQLVDDRINLDGHPFEGWLVYTGMLDALFGYCFGELPYRSLQFKFETLNQTNYQSVGTVNYPNAPGLTRITEFKHLTGQESAVTTIVREFPQSYDRHDLARNIPYYPVFTKDNKARYQRYSELALSIPKFISLGRLGEYRYLNMDDAIANALTCFSKEISGRVAQE